MTYKRFWRNALIAVAVATTILPTALPAGGQTAAPAGGEVPADSIVHSWALAPAFNDLPQGGSRPNLSYEAAPGSELRDQITLFNLSNVQLTFRVYATDAINNEDGAFDLLPGDERPRGVGAWVTLPQENITLAARSQATMPVTIKVPAAAAPGDHAGGIVASSRAEGTGPDGKLVALDRRTGPRVYIRVAGPLSPSVTVERLSASYTPALSPFGGKAEVTYRVENRGNVRMGASQRVSVAGPLGLARRQQASDLPELLPGEGITLRATFDGVSATLLATAKVKISPAPIGQAVGRPATSSRLTLAPPYAVLGLALAVGLLAKARRAYLRRQDGSVAVPSLP